MKDAIAYDWRQDMKNVGGPSRKERRAEAEQKRKDWYDIILQEYKNNMAAVDTMGEATDMTDKWLDGEIRRNPQMKQLIMDAAVKVREVVEAAAKRAWEKSDELMKKNIDRQMLDDISRGSYELQRAIFAENVGVTKEVNGTKIRVDSVQDTPEGTDVKITVQPAVSAEHINVKFKVGESAFNAVKELQQIVENANTQEEGPLTAAVERMEEEIRGLTCFKCEEKDCKFRDDPYNTDGACLADK